MEDKKLKLLQNHLEKFGFIFPNNQIYGGFANSYDLGPLGVLMANNLKKYWWKKFVFSKPNSFALDSKILTHKKVFESSGHIKNFIDYFIENKNNGKRYKIEDIVSTLKSPEKVLALPFKKIEEIIKREIKVYDNAKCNWSEIKKFNLMFETKIGKIEDQKQVIYLRPETAQGIFVNFKNILRSTRTKLPFRVGQIGKAFRNEITPKNFIFKTREFEQMELEIFTNPESANKIFDEELKKTWDFLKEIGIDEKKMKFNEHSGNDLAHYSKKTVDVEFKFPFGMGEIVGITNRGDYDIKQHNKFSNEELCYFDSKLNKKIIPYTIEPSFGVERILFALFISAFKKENVNNKERIIFKFKDFIAPYFFAVLPLNQKAHSKTAKKLFKKLIMKGYSVTFDENGSIGKRYRRQDAIGTPYVLTVIDETEKEQKITIRFRDTMKQKTILIKELEQFINI